MNHRKQSHSQQANMFRCKKFKEGKCFYSENECWYKHEEKLNDDDNQDDQKQVVWEAQDNLHPPDVIGKMMKMMEKLVEKVNLLENHIQKNQ